MLEFSLREENDLKRATEWLSEIVDKEAAQQFVFVLTAMREKSWANHCDKAVKSLGFDLAEHWGGEESFFDLVGENVSFKELRSSDVLKNKFKRDNYHSIAMLEFSQNNEESIYLIVDFVYGHIAGEGRRNNVLFLRYQCQKEKILDRVGEYYGGKWKIVNILNKENKTFRHIV